MPKKKRPLKRGRKTHSSVSRKARLKKPRRAKLTLKQRIARAKKLEALDAGKSTFKVLPRALSVARDNVPFAPPPVITGSVGRWEKGARNLQADVETVQRLLETAAQTLKAADLDPKGVDGKIARQSAKSNTIAAIEAFQKRSNEGLIAILARHTSHGSCSAEVSRSIIFPACLITQLPMVVYESSQRT